MEKKVKMHLPEHHVHFDSIEQLEKNNDVIIKSIDENTIDVHVGFLKINHSYRISFSTPRSMLNIGTNSKVLPFVAGDEESTNCRIHSVLEDVDNNMVNFEVDYNTITEKVSNEVLKCQISDSERIITFILTCRVIEKCKGTPLLRNGVHCTGVLPSDGDDEDNNESELELEK